MAGAERRSEDFGAAALTSNAQHATRQRRQPCSLQATAPSECYRYIETPQIEHECRKLSPNDYGDCLDKPLVARPARVLTSYVKKCQLRRGHEHEHEHEHEHDSELASNRTIRVNLLYSGIFAVGC
jgi:hypothetical protein